MSPRPLWVFATVAHSSSVSSSASMPHIRWCHRDPNGCSRWCHDRKPLQSAKGLLDINHGKDLSLTMTSSIHQWHWLIRVISSIHQSDVISSSQWHHLYSPQWRHSSTTMTFGQSQWHRLITVTSFINHVHNDIIHDVIHHGDIVYQSKWHHPLATKFIFLLHTKNPFGQLAAFDLSVTSHHCYNHISTAVISFINRSDVIIEATIMNGASFVNKAPITIRFHQPQ